MIGTRELSLLHSVQASSWSYAALYSLGTGALSQGVKWPGPEGDDLRSGVKSEWVCVFTVTYAFVVCIRTTLPLSNKLLSAFFIVRTLTSEVASLNKRRHIKYF